MNNLEFDHADIFADLAQIQRQFHHLVRTVPGTGLIVAPHEAALDAVLAMGCWTPVERVGEGGDSTWRAEPSTEDGSAFRVRCDGALVGEVRWELTGRHNVANALAALAAARHAGVPPAAGVAALSVFRGVKRRMELRGEARGARVYDDFAHHPTAIRTTLDGLRKHVGRGRIIAVLEPRSNTMRLGVHKDELPAALAPADEVLVHAPANLGWDAGAVLAPLGERARVYARTDDIVADLAARVRPGDHVLVMSNGGFENLHQRLLDALGA
jgi:UDP-N-acetylmuramate: L-alanyl-gamma-D-glutamyl-meso-diaminopimelate ligase